MENHDNRRFANYTTDMALVKNALAFTILSDGIPTSTSLLPSRRPFPLSFLRSRELTRRSLRGPRAAPHRRNSRQPKPRSNLALEIQHRQPAVLLDRQAKPNPQPSHLQRLLLPNIPTVPHLLGRRGRRFTQRVKWESDYHRPEQQGPEWR